MMYSLSKTPIAVETAQRIITHHFGSRSRIVFFEELMDGYFNAAYQLELQDGLKCVLKIAPVESVQVMNYEQNIMSAEVEVLRLVRSHTEMPVPAVFCHDSSRQLIHNEFFIMEYIPGIAFNKLKPQLPPDEKDAIYLQTGHFLRQMNAIPGTDFGCASWSVPRCLTWRDGFVRMLVNVLADGQEIRAPLRMPYDELHTLLQSFYHTLDDFQNPVLVHWDLWDGNIFIDPESKRITGVIDFERSLWGDPLMEVNFSDYGKNRAFMTGYGLEMVDTPIKRTRRTLYNIYLMLIMVIECYFRHYETKDQENWARRQLDMEIGKLSK